MGLSHCDVESIFICHYQMWDEKKWNLLWALMRAKAMRLGEEEKKKAMWLKAQGWALLGECLVTSAESPLHEPFDTDSRGRGKWNRCVNRGKEFDTPTRHLLKNTHILNNPDVHSAICFVWMKGINTLPAFHGDLTCCFSWNDGSPVNIRGGSVQVAPHCALCIALSTRAPCCIGTSKLNTSGPLRNWKNRTTEI